MAAAPCDKKRIEKGSKPPRGKPILSQMKTFRPQLETRRKSGAGRACGLSWIPAGFLAMLVFCGCAANKPAAKVTSVEMVKSTKSWDGATLPPYKPGQPEITIMRITIPPRHALPVHKHPVINAGVLLKGRLTVTTESGRVIHIKEGDPLVEVVETWHYGRNDGNVPAEILVFYAGTKGTPISVKKE